MIGVVETAYRNYMVRWIRPRERLPVQAGYQVQKKIAQLYRSYIAMTKSAIRYSDHCLRAPDM